MRRTIKISVTVNAESDEQVQQIADHCKAVVHALIDGQPIVYRNNQGQTVHITRNPTQRDQTVLALSWERSRYQDQSADRPTAHCGSHLNRPLGFRRRK